FAMVRDEGFRVRLLDAATAHFPALRSLLTADLRSAVTGRVSLGAIGVAGVLWASSGFAARARHAFGEVFRTRRTGLILGRFRGIANSTAQYGTVGGVFGLIASLYATMWLLLVGAETTAVLRDRRLPDPSGSPRASGPA